MDSVPFSRAVAVSSQPGTGPGSFRVELLEAWEADGARQHGGVLVAVATSAALAALADRALGGVHRGPDTGAVPRWQPLAVSAVFVRAGCTGPAEAATTVLGDTADGSGEAVSVVRSTLCQGGDVLLDTTVTARQTPDQHAPPSSGEQTSSEREPPERGPVSRLPPAPPPELIGKAGPRSAGPPLASACEVVIDPSTTAYRRKERAEPAMRGWVRPRGEEPDVLFALFAGDILPTGLFNYGLVGWAPTVQLTALLRAAPAPGWLRVETETRTIAGGWFDEDVTVFDAGGRLICQARQLARSPRPRG
jgi:hypothetical protein